MKISKKISHFEEFKEENDWLIRNLNNYGNSLIAPADVKKYGIDNIKKFLEKLTGNEIEIDTYNVKEYGEIDHIARICKRGKLKW